MADRTFTHILARSAGVVANLCDRFRRSRHGNVSMIFALVTVPLIFAVGMGIDYGAAAKRQTKFDAAADAAALAAVTPALMSDTTSAAQTAAINMFNAQASTIGGATYSPSNLTVTITQTGTTSIARTAVVTYKASSQNAFSGILGMSSITLAGSSTASVSAAPNINFYLMLDTSPSMALPATSTGISAMLTATKSQTDTVNGQTVYGCAFACHETCPSCENPPLGNPVVNGQEMDNYAVAKTNLNLTLRIDNVATAASNLATTAQSTGAKNGAAYQMSLNTFDVAVNSPSSNSYYNKVTPLSSNFSSVSTQASNIQVLEVYSNNWLTSSNDNSDTDTDWDNAMNVMNTNMPNPGGGTNVAGDTPQGVLFLVTDGVMDELDTKFGIGSRAQAPMWMATSPYQASNYDWCTTVKNRGIRIAVLYTTYISLQNSSSWYDNAPPNGSGLLANQNNIAPALQACASPGLFTQVNTDQDISAALTGLFQAVVATAHLTH